MITNFYGFWEDWLNYHKVTFDGVNKVIQVNYGVTELSVQEDLYSDWKEWASMYDHAKFEPALRSVGGDPTTGANFLGATYFLTNGWRMRTWTGDHRLILTGNLFTEEGDPAFIPTEGDSNTEIAFNVSTLVEGFGFPVTGEHSPEQISQAVWMFAQAMLDNPGTVGRMLLDMEEQGRKNQNLIAAGL